VSPSDPSSPSEELARELVALVRGLRELGTRIGAVQGRRLDVPAASVLATLGDAGPLRLSTLADRLSLDLSTVSRQVPALERAGWLAREPDPDDRRAQLLRLTDEGQAALAERRRSHAALLDRALPGWTGEEVRELAATLGRLNADITAARPSASLTSLSPGSLSQAAPVHQEAS
jgi:DNA-binding MarR family transcriptional regulator